MDLPRLTGALRSFCKDRLKNDSTLASDQLEKQIGRKKRTMKYELHQEKAKNYVSESAIMKSLKNMCQSYQPLCEAYDDLMEVAGAVCGNDYDNVTTVVEECVLSLIETFYVNAVESRSHASVSQIQDLKVKFGCITNSSVIRAINATKIIFECTGEETFAKLKDKLSPHQNAEKIVEFGSNIKFQYSGEVNELPAGINLVQPSTAVLFDTNSYIPSKTKVGNESVKNSVSENEWLLSEVRRCFNDSEISVKDVCDSLYEYLESPKKNEELQDDLFNLLGFEKFEFILKLLEKRNTINKERKENILAKQLFTQNKEMRLDKNKAAYGCQVIVQSENQKVLLKQINKYEKKQKKMLTSEESDDDGLQFDIANMRAQRRAALMYQKTLPRQTTSDEVSYPYVFDSYKLAKDSTSFMSGCKMVLPVESTHHDMKEYEEVCIPASGAPPVDVGQDLIPIASLDDIGRVAFQGMKTLNRIQSVVYPVAYHSNENLLICAPTGAGKTNIAMMTIVNQIKMHIVDGVIEKDKFKIIYIAPMKALAAEMVQNFGKRLQPLGIAVRELTGDMSLTKAEIMHTQMLVTTPEKWDVVTRKSTGDVALTQIVCLLIIDEVHLLHDDRGAVIETLVARTLRQVESSQRMIRIVGLSATLPNYLDVAHFLNVNPRQGLFFFDGRFRPVPLATSFIGIKSTQRFQQINDMNKVCYEKIVEQLRDGQQVMIFVHARNETVRTANVMMEMARNKGQVSLFEPKNDKYTDTQKAMGRTHNRTLLELFECGISVHHAGMLRSDRNVVERLFSEGSIRVLVCTATLAWGVNLPAHAVFIKGTQIYDAKHGNFIDLSILDVMQIFGRAGRPQFDTFGLGTIITTHDKLAHYLSLMTRQNPIESQFIHSLADNLNAEVALGSVSTIDEAVQWLSYTYLYVRMRANPLAYGVNHKCLMDDPLLEEYRRDLIVNAARQLDKARMMRFDEPTSYLYATDLGRTSSHFYIKCDTIEKFNEKFTPVMYENDIFGMVATAQEFDQIKVRDEELKELDLHMKTTCGDSVPGGTENAYGKVNILMQVYISRANLETHSLCSDQAYIAQNSTRIVRALFEMSITRGWPHAAAQLLEICKCFEKRIWNDEHPLRQFSHIKSDIINKLEARNMKVSRINEMTAGEVGQMVSHQRMGHIIKQAVSELPRLEIQTSIQPITRGVLRVRLSLKADFKWNDRVHGYSEPFWIWIEDPDNSTMYHHEYYMLSKKVCQSDEPEELIFTIPITEPLPPQYYVRAASDRWLCDPTVEAISFKHLLLPERHPPHTDLLDLTPLPVTALGNPQYEAIYSFSHFNPIQTQIFHTLYHNDCNVLVGAPTGSGKTVAAELAIFRVFDRHPGMKAVYIAPMKALVVERMTDWRVKFEVKMKKKVVELTGDVTPDMRAVARADLIVTTPEKWDGISRSWQTRNYVKSVVLIVIDEIHLLGEDRGPVLEVIVSRTNFISSHTLSPVRVVGLSTALANARDVADWLNIQQVGLFNFRPSVRPVPLEVHIAGFPGKYYCPRMATMNKPVFKAILTHSPTKPALVFVSSRRQTRLTALDLMAFLVADENPKRWLKLPENEMENIISGIHDSNLKLALAFGIGLHHAGLHQRDRKTTEELFVNQKIQVLIATSTLAWGVNFPAHLVVIKGTEYFDGATRRYVDFAITDVLQMMGRAGRPQFDDQGKAVVLVHDVKKHFYKKFLYEPFPVESCLLNVLPNHLNAEVVAGTISSKQEAMDYLTWTYFFRRLVMNPTYYSLIDTAADNVNVFLSQLIEKSVAELESCYCVEVGEDGKSLVPATLGRIASYYYLHHTSVKLFREKLAPELNLQQLVDILSQVHEFSELPVRHNEDVVNKELSTHLPLEVDQHTMDNSHTKTHLLLQCHMQRGTLPSSDYFTDTRSVLDQAIRVIQAMLDVVADSGWLVSTLQVINFMQAILQARWPHDNPIAILPHVDVANIPSTCPALPVLVAQSLSGVAGVAKKLLGGAASQQNLQALQDVLKRLPILNVSIQVNGSGAEKISVPLRKPNRPPPAWIPVDADQEYVVVIQLEPVCPRKQDCKAFTPRFPKSKNEGWILVLGDVESREVVALKRVGKVGSKTNAHLTFFTPEKLGRVIYTLYLMSDCYLGLDQQYDVCLEVTSK